MGQRAIKVGILTAIGKAVGGCVQNAHQDGRGAKGQTLTMRKLPFVRFAVGHGIHLSTRYSPKPKLAWRAGWATGKKCKVMPRNHLQTAGDRSNMAERRLQAKA